MAMCLLEKYFSVNSYLGVFQVDNVFCKPNILILTLTSAVALENIGSISMKHRMKTGATPLHTHEVHKPLMFFVV